MIWFQLKKCSRASVKAAKIDLHCCLEGWFSDYFRVMCYLLAPSLRVLLKVHKDHESRELVYPVATGHNPDFGELGYLEEGGSGCSCRGFLRSTGWCRWAAPELQICRERSRPVISHWERIGQIWWESMGFPDEIRRCRGKGPML